MNIGRGAGAAFVESYGRAWERWDIEGFVGLFSDDVVYVVHPTDETVVGAEALRGYLHKEEAEQGAVSVRMGKPMVDGDQVVGEFWVTGGDRAAEETFAGCFIARLDPADGRCTHFREYWFDIEGHAEPYLGWGD
jgi:ketosteroid isomerase-like protein